MISEWILPLLIGIVAAYLLLSILYNNNILKQKFADLGALIQLQTSRPVYYGLGWVPNNWNGTVDLPPSSQAITAVDSPLYPDTVTPPIFNYYPQTPLNPNQIPENVNMFKKVVDSNDIAFNPVMQYNPYDSAYWGITGIPVPVKLYPPTNIDAVKGVEDKI
jgi:hypothetical protein